MKTVETFIITKPREMYSLNKLNVSKYPRRFKRVRYFSEFLYGTYVFVNQ